jgi:hypothetical protein
MDESTTERKPYRMNVPVGASIVIAIVVLAIAAATLKPKRAR